MAASGEAWQNVRENAERVRNTMEEAEEAAKGRHQNHLLQSTRLIWLPQPLMPLCGLKANFPDVKHCSSDLGFELLLEFKNETKTFKNPKMLLTR